MLSLHKIPRALVGRRDSRGAAPPGTWMNMDIMVGTPWSCKINQASWSCEIIQVPFDPLHKQMGNMRYPCSSSWAKLGETSWCHPQQKVSLGLCCSGLVAGSAWQKTRPDVHVIRPTCSGPHRTHHTCHNPVR